MPRRKPLPSEGPPSYRNFPLSLCREATGEWDCQAPQCSMQSDRLLWLCAESHHPCPQRHWCCLCSCDDEATYDGRYWWPLNVSQGRYCHPGHLHQSRLWGHLQDPRLPDLWKETVFNQVSLPVIHGPSCEKPHQSICSKDPGSRYELNLLKKKEKKQTQTFDVKLPRIFFFCEIAI